MARKTEHDRPRALPAAEGNARGPPARDPREAALAARDASPMDAHDVRDAEEQSVDDFVQEVDLALMQMKSRDPREDRRGDPAARGRQLRPLPGVRAAEIAAARLRALPFAALCRDCQEETENRRRATSARRRPSSACRRSSAERDRCGPAPATEGGAIERRAQARLRVGRRPRDRPRRRADRDRHPAAAGHAPVPAGHPAARGGPGELRGARQRRGRASARSSASSPSATPPSTIRVESDLYRHRHAHPHPQDVQASRTARCASWSRGAALPHPAGHPVPAVPEGPGRAHPRGRRRAEQEIEVQALAQSALRLLPAGGGALPHPLRRARRRWPATSRSRRASPTSSPAACPRSTPPRSRSSSRSSTCARGSSASTRSWSRTSRCSRSAARSRARSRPSCRRTSASTTCASR